MKNKNANILSGPINEIPIPVGSIGKYFLDCMKKRDPEHVTIIDFLTGDFFVNDQVLQYSLKASSIFKNLGVKKGDVISIIVENTMKYCIPELGALYIGATVNLLNPLYSLGELKHALTIAKPKVIICSDVSLNNIMQVCEELSLLETKILLLENKASNHVDVTTFEDLLKAIPNIESDTFEPEMINSTEDGAFILMSSGTTGLPKGVFITHDNVRAALNYLQHEDYFGVSDKDTTIFLLPFFHIFGVLIQLLSVCFGLKVVILNKFKPNIFLDSIQKHRPTKLYLVPPLVLFLAKSPLVDNYDTSSIRDIIVGGAPLGKDLQVNVTKRLINVTIRQIYGLTETTAAVTLQTFDKIASGSVGVLVPHAHAKVWDDGLKQNAGPRELGELCFKGPMILKEYYKNKKVTQECMDKEGFYHTGDIGYYDEEGNFYIVDRVKEIIKYKGFQVPPAELEALIVTHPSVKDCAVIGIPDKRAGQIPLAYVVKQDGATVFEQEIIDYVAERISQQKHLYGGVKFTEEIPKTLSGKILRRKLVERFHTFE